MPVDAPLDPVGEWTSATDGGGLQEYTSWVQQAAFPCQAGKERESRVDPVLCIESLDGERPPLSIYVLHGAVSEYDFRTAFEEAYGSVQKLGFQKIIGVEQDGVGSPGQVNTPVPVACLTGSRLKPMVCNPRVSEAGADLRGAVGRRVVAD
jgi:hypothetical protein